MTKLREQMTNEMVLRGLAPNTQRTYLQAVTLLARHYGRSPDCLSKREVKAYLLSLHQDTNRSTSTCNVAAAAMRFLYHRVLGRSTAEFEIPFARKPKQLPQVLSREEVSRLLARTQFQKHRTLFMIAYCAGLRVSEIVKLRPVDIDSDRMVIRVEQGKGGKDRLVTLSDGLLRQLRAYWRASHPTGYLFPRYRPDWALSVTTAQKAFGRSKRKAGIEKIGGIHALRHAYATHLLAGGLPVQQLQRLMGHRNIQSTLRYVHWIPDYRAGRGAQDLIAPLGLPS